jgi:hypothetical protein
VAELVDALDLGSSAERRGGSSPFIRTSPLSPGAERGHPTCRSHETQMAAFRAWSVAAGGSESG